MAATTRQPSLTDLTNAPWAILPPLIPPATAGGRPRAVDLREGINTILDRKRTGCQGDLLPHDLRPHSTVDESCARWGRDGAWPQMLDALRAAVRTPQAPSPEPTPRAASLDRQAVQTTAQGGERGDDGGKNSTGRTRPSSVEVLGLWLVGLVSRAALDDAVAAPQGLKDVGLETDPRLDVMWADHQYQNHGRNDWLTTEATGNWRVDVGRRPAGSKGCLLWPTRWGVARPLAWLGRCRRHSTDDERRPDSRASMLRVRAIHLRLTRLQPSHVDPPFRYRVAAEETFRRDT